MSLITSTDIGNVIILNHRMATMTDPKWVEAGHVALCILLGPKNEPQCYGLVWEWGGDWTGFGDGDQGNIEMLGGWEPDAIAEAIIAANAMLPDNEQLAEDLQWYADWAQVAQSTIDNADDND